MRGIHRVDVVHRDAADRLAGRKRLGQLNLDRVNARNVIDDDPDGPAIPWDARLPLRLGETASELREGPRSLFEPLRQGVGA
jgi:hypothetical protein